MNNKICVYTCITGDYDDLHEISHPEKSIDYYCFTNNKKLTSKTWKIIYIENNNLDDCRLARKIKILGHPKVNSYDIAVWSDADVVWQKPIADFIKKYFQNTSLSIFKHHARNSIHDEAIACLKCRKDDKEIIEKTLNYYHSVHYPDDNGLCESTVFIKKPKDKLVKDTMEQWFTIVNNYSRRDQLSFNYAVWKTGLPVFYIPLVVWDNPWFYTTKHAIASSNASCHVYFGDPASVFDFDKYQVYPYQIKNNTYSFNATIPNNTSIIELNITNITGTEYKNAKLAPSPNHLNFYDTLTINNHESFFYTDRGVIIAHGNFKKGQKMSFSIELHPPTTPVFTKITEYQGRRIASLTKELNTQTASLIQVKKQNTALKKENTNLKQELTSLQVEYQKVLNSKGWQALQKLRKLTTPLRPHK